MCEGMSSLQLKQSECVTLAAQLQHRSTEVDGEDAERGLTGRGVWQEEGGGERAGALSAISDTKGCHSTTLLQPA
jgi:hypothetical protein